MFAAGSLARGGDSRGAHPYVSALCRLQANNTTTAKIKTRLGRLFSCKVLPSRQRGQVFPSLIFPLLCVIHFVLFEPGGLRAQRICLPLSITSRRWLRGRRGNDTGFTLRKSFSYPAEASRNDSF